MKPSDYWPDARLMPRDKLKYFVQKIRARREALGLSNADLGRQVRAIIEAHNAVPGRDIVHVKTVSKEWSFRDAVKYELNAIERGTRKYVVGYLAWLCCTDEASARNLYEMVGLPFRPYYDAVAASQGGGGDARRWPRLIETNARYERLEVISFEVGSLSLVDLADRRPVAGTLKLEERFCFRFDAPLTGYVLGFQYHRGIWYPLPLTNERLHLRITVGRQFLPRHARTGRPIPLSEDAEPGRYGFALLVAGHRRIVELSALLRSGDEIPPEAIPLAARIIADLPPNQRAIYRTDVLIKA